MGNCNSPQSCLLALTARVVSSSLGTVIVLSEATLDLLMIKLQYIRPSISVKHVYEAVPYPHTDASAKWCSSMPLVALNSASL